MPKVTWEVSTLTLGRNLLMDISGIWQYRMCVPRWWTAPKVFCNGPCFLVSMPCIIFSHKGEWDLWPTEYGKGDEMSRPWLCYITLGGLLVVNSCSCSPTGFIEASKHCLILLLELIWTDFLCRLFSFLPLANNSLFKMNSLFIIQSSLLQSFFCFYCLAYPSISGFISLHFFSFKCLASWIMPSLYIYYLFLAHSRYSTRLLVLSYQDFSVTTGKCINTDS